MLDVRGVEWVELGGGDLVAGLDALGVTGVPVLVEDDETVEARREDRGPCVGDSRRHRTAVVCRAEHRGVRVLRREVPSVGASRDGPACRMRAALIVALLVVDDVSEEAAKLFTSFSRDSDKRARSKFSETESVTFTRRIGKSDDAKVPFLLIPHCRISTSSPSTSL